ncbi:MAG: amino acid adenylation domain-containing protein [Gloeobacteraceae cyanobacterium ES-bin-144]|nr:amino acid adenylation domain-containing protein [Verrucomicrobiales bacterium]
MQSPAPVSNTLVHGAACPLHEVLDRLSAVSPEQLAFRYLTDGEIIEETITYSALARRSRNIAAGLAAHNTTGKPVLLIQAPGMSFIESLFACWYAGAIAVPAYPPRSSRYRQRLQSILKDSGAIFALASGSTPAIEGVKMLDPDAFQNDGNDFDDIALRHHGPCLLQYTSGSTSEPKGVMISHHNLRSHYASLKNYTEPGPASALSWLPPYHDMGLVLKILYALEAAIPLTFFSPDHFIQKPLRWLQAISRYRAEMSGAPNFAFDACLRSVRDDDLDRLDLSCWKMAPCGAERVRPATLERFAKRFARCGFRPEAFLPGYGMAETTLIVTASPPNTSPKITNHPQHGRHVSCGPPLPGVQLRIADPISGISLSPMEIGEIRVKSDVVAEGYWNRIEASKATFGADGELRTGDLGFLQDGHLYVSGRIKDLIIIDGINHSPEDIEETLIADYPEITAAAAFSTNHDDREVITIVVEVKATESTRVSALCQVMRNTIAAKMEMPVHRIVCVRSGSIPRTTSGKIRRSACREKLSNGSPNVLHDEQSETITTQVESLNAATLIELFSELFAIDEISPNDRIIDFGLSSLEATRFAAMLRSRKGLDVSVSNLFTGESFLQLAASLSSKPNATTGNLNFSKTNNPHSGKLTHAQERMLFLHQIAPQSAAYHVFGAVELSGPLAVQTLADAFDSMIANHEILRSRHGLENGLPRVWIDNQSLAHIEFHPLNVEANVDKLLANFAQKPFTLAYDPPIRAMVVEINPTRHYLAICAHHIVADGWSMRLMAIEIAKRYAGIPVVSPSAGVTYRKYAYAHREWIDSGAIEEQITYWKNRLEGHSDILQLPTDYKRPETPSSIGGLVTRDLTIEGGNRISNLAKLHHATPFMVYLSSLLLLLKQHGAGNDLVVAIPVANRNHSAAENLVGTLVNTLPFRFQLESNHNFTDLLNQVRDASFEMQENQDAPFEKIIDRVKPTRSIHHSPLAQVMFDHQEIPVTREWTHELSCKPYTAHRGATQFDISVLVTDFGSHQQLAIEYRIDLFNEKSITHMIDRFLTIVDQVSQSAELPISRIHGLSNNDIALLNRVSKGPIRPSFTTRTTTTLIAERVAKHPQRTAIISLGRSLDYQTLADRSDRLAYAFHKRGIGSGDRIAVLIERDIDLPVALLAIWKCGAAYVPLDRSNPKNRLQLILADQAPIRILVSPTLFDHLPDGTDVILFQEDLMKDAALDTLPSAKPSDPAYIIYTSGSTGAPKGVIVSHGAVANFLRSMAETPGFTEADRLLAVTTISFDISILELFLPLVSGGSVEIVSTAIARSGHSLLREIDSSDATVMQATPATWRLLLESGWKGSPNLKILCGGEALDLPLAKKLVLNGCQLWNLYGPTETTVWSTCWRCSCNPESIQIGSPIANTNLHILSEDGALLPVGVSGTLWISGEGLAIGYWNRPELTDERFTSIRCIEGILRRAYNTGDLARWSADGSIELLGRADNQVKIRGFRVELGEIETVVATHPLVSQARVAFRGNTNTSERLICWITLKPGGMELKVDELRAYLSTKLPPYMLPSEILIISDFPLNSSGKVDVASLTTPGIHTAFPETSLSATETQLMAIWKDLLQTSLIHTHDDWFQIGGHSLLALRLFSRIHQDFNRRLPLSTILEFPTLSSMAKKIDETQPEAQYT